MSKPYKLKIHFKEKSGALLFGVLLVFLVVSILFFGCNKNSPEQISSEPYYEIFVEYNGAHNLKIDETIVFTNQTSNHLTTIPLHLYPNAFQKDATASPFDNNERTDYHINGKFGKIEVLEVKINRLNCDFVLSHTDNTILEVPCSVDINETVMIEIKCSVTLPECAHRLGVFENTVNLTGFYPQLCHFDENGFVIADYSHLGDPFVHDASTYSVSLTCPKEYVVAGSGKNTNTFESDLSHSVDFYAENIRDFAIVLSKDFSHQTGIANIGNGVEVTYFYLSDVNPSDTLSLAIDALEQFSYAFGDYPHLTYTLVESNMTNGGMEYGALSIIASCIEDVVIHETAHQWWYGIVGNNQISESWLDEGLAEFSTGYYYFLKGDEAKYNAFISSVEAEYDTWLKMSSLGSYGVLERDLCDFLTEGEYVATAYVKSAILFHTLNKMMGEDNFKSALQDYCKSNAFKIATKQNLVTSFENHYPGIGGIVNSFVEGKDR